MTWWFLTVSRTVKISYFDRKKMLGKNPRSAHTTNKNSKVWGGRRPIGPTNPSFFLIYEIYKNCFPIPSPSHNLQTINSCCFHFLEISKLTLFNTKKSFKMHLFSASVEKHLFVRLFYGKLKWDRKEKNYMVEKIQMFE